MSERAPYLSEPGWQFGRTLGYEHFMRLDTNGEIRIEDGKLLLFDYLADDPKEATVSCPVRDVSVSLVRRWFGAGVALELGAEGKWYFKPPSSRLKTARRETRRLIEAIAEAQR